MQDEGDHEQAAATAYLGAIASKNAYTEAQRMEARALIQGQLGALQRQAMDQLSPLEQKNLAAALTSAGVTPVKGAMADNAGAMQIAIDQEMGRGIPPASAQISAARQSQKEVNQAAK